MSVMKAFRAGIVILVMVGLGGCGCCGGSKTVKETKETTIKEQPTTSTTTLGDELKSLKDAYDKGIITEKEYNKSKESILKQRTEDN